MSKYIYWDSNHGDKMRSSYEDGEVIIERYWPQREDWKYHKIVHGMEIYSVVNLLPSTPIIDDYAEKKG